MALNFILRGELPSRLDASPLLPELLETLNLAQIEQIPVLVGNRLISAGEVFQIQGSLEDGIVRYSGKLDKLSRIGRLMNRGRIEVHGSPAHECGAEMSGGSLVICGDVGHSLGIQQRGGTICVSGNVGDNLGGCYPGSLRGQRGGTILVRGNAGHGAGQYQRRGLIVIAGDVGDEAALAQRAGTIVIGGLVGERCVYDQRRGTVVMLAEPSSNWRGSGRFTAGYNGRPVMLELLTRTIHRQAKEAGFELPDSFLRALESTSYQLWHGDATVIKRGEVWVRT